MEDDDDFGGLYTDLPQPFAPSSPSPPKAQPIHRQQLPQQPPRHVEPAIANSNPVEEPSVDLIDKDVKFDIEDEEIDEEPLIPGLTGVAVEAPRKIGEADDWDDSDDSEDDLQIVLDDGGRLDAGDRPDAGDDGGLDVAAAAGDVEERDWGENSTQPVDGEKKDVGESVKAVAPKIGYSNQGYHHPFHSQFKYVRTGAVPIPAATSSTPGGPLSQIRPLANMNPVAGHGRGDWRPAGIKGVAAMQKGFQAGSGVPMRGHGAAGLGFGGGLEFVLPSQK